MLGGTIPLEYSKQPRRRWRRYVMVGIALAILIAAGTYLRLRWPAIQLQMAARQVTSQSDAAIAGADTIIYSDVPRFVQGLSDTYLYEMKDPRENFTPSVHRISPAYNDPDPPPDMRVAHGPGMPPVGRRRVPGGEWRSILVMINSKGEHLEVKDFQPVHTGIRRVELHYGVYSRATLKSGTRFKQIRYGFFGFDLSQTDELTVYGAALDARDDSHLTIGYEINGQRGTIDGWMQPDETMLFKIRSGPTTSLVEAPAR